MKLLQEEVQVRSADIDIRCVVIRPDVGVAWPGLVFYTDIFQLTPSSLRCARRFASAGFVVCVPEIYPRSALVGVHLDFDEEGKRVGQAAAEATTTADFDADRTSVLGYLEARPDVTGALRAVGFCIGGHLAFRAGFDNRVGATACYYPTGLHNGALGADVDAGTLGDAARISGRLLLVFGSRDPHVPADARGRIVAELEKQSIDVDLSVYAAEHAFMRDEGPRHDPALTDVALSLGLEFLTRG